MSPRAEDGEENVREQPTPLSSHAPEVQANARVQTNPLVQNNPWEQLRRHTAARIALGRVGASLPTQEVLKFGLAHAQARDAVQTPLDVALLQADLANEGFATLTVQSRCADRPEYLMRPDRGRVLDETSALSLRQQGSAGQVALVIGDGLSSKAVQCHATPLLVHLRERLHLEWHHLKIVIASQARVALADEVGEILGAELSLMLIGERPGLSSPDSLGVYLTYRPKIGRHDGERNCISNIRPQGLPYTQAARIIAYLAQESLRQKLSGVGLKDDSGASLLTE